MYWHISEIKVLANIPERPECANQLNKIAGNISRSTVYWEIQI